MKRSDMSKILQKLLKGTEVKGRNKEVEDGPFYLSTAGPHGGEGEGDTVLRLRTDEVRKGGPKEEVKEKGEDEDYLKRKEEVFPGVRMGAFSTT